MPINFYDITYGVGLGLSSPLWAWRSKARAKVLDALAGRMGHLPSRVGDAPAVMIHAVSVGELNAARTLIDALKNLSPRLHIIVSTTTTTGLERAIALYGRREDVTVIRYPLDFTAAVNRLFDALRPSLVILVELELWPNFIAQAERRGIPVVVVNGRITRSSFDNFRRGRGLPGGVVRKMFSRLSAVCAQDSEYAERFIKLGASSSTTTVTGSLKFDSAATADSLDPSAVAQLATDLNLRRPLWVCGSTGPGEEAIVLAAYTRLLKDFPDLQLAIVPRKPERFDEVADLIRTTGRSLLRRSVGRVVAPSHPKYPHATAPPTPPVVLGDTMGELRNFYASADVVFVGRTLVDLGDKQHGSDMIEPAALGKSCIVGPFTSNFADAMRAFRAAGAMVEIAQPGELAPAVATLLTPSTPTTGSTTATGTTLGERAADVVRQNRGAAARTLDAIAALLPVAKED